MTPKWRHFAAKLERILKRLYRPVSRAEGGLDADKASEVLGVSERTVFRNRSNIRNQGEIDRNTWGGRRRYTMTIEAESKFLQGWEGRANEGGVLSFPPIHAALVEKLGRSIPISTTYRLLARHGWRKVQPDTKHPKSDSAIQEEYKKTSQDCGDRLYEESEETAHSFDVSG